MTYITAYIQINDKIAHTTSVKTIMMKIESPLIVGAINLLNVATKRIYPIHWMDSLNKP